MTNAEKYKTPDERLKAHHEMCKGKKDCACVGNALCLLEWLEKEVGEELLPCPFCGGEASVAVSLGDQGEPITYRVKCECGISTDYFKKKNMAIIAWNRRNNETTKA